MLNGVDTTYSDKGNNCQIVRSGPNSNELQNVVQKQSNEIDCNSLIISYSLYFLFSCLDKYINSGISSITRNTSVCD